MWVGCAAHVLHLFTKDLLELETFSAPLEKAVSIAKFFKSCHLAHSLLEDKQELTYGTRKKLTLPGATRWNSAEACIRSVLGSEDALKMVSLDRAMDQVDSRTTQVDQVIACIKDPTTFSSMAAALPVLSAIKKMLNLLQSDQPRLGEIYATMRALRDELEEVAVDCADEVLELFDNRWAFVHKPIHALAYLLHPRAVATGVPIDRLDHLDPALNLGESMAEDLGLQSTGGGDFFQEYQTLWSQDSTVWLPRLWSSQATKDPWACHGSRSPILAKLAEIIFRLPGTSASVERLYSNMGFLQGTRRTHITPARLTKAAYCYFNLRHLDDEEE